MQGRFAFAQENALEAAANAKWWTELQDPVLDGLMERALSQNLELKVAVSRIEQARAQLRAAGVSSQFSGGVDASARAQISDGNYSDVSQVSVAPVFVLDLFGENQRRREAAAAGVDNAVFRAAAGRLALQLELVSRYFDLRYFQELEALRLRSISNQRDVVSAIRERAKVQDESRLTVSRSEAELQLRRSLIPQARQGQYAAVLSIATLLAEPQEDLSAQLSVAKPQPRPPHNISPGVPAALLKNRPDVRAAEAALASAVAQIGISEAQLYPSLRLNGSLTVTQGGSLSVGPTFSLPVFDRKARLAGRDVAVARAAEAELFWRNTVLVGVEEVQLGLSALETSDKQVTTLTSAVSKFRDVASLSTEAFRLQAITYIEVLDVEESLNQSELQLINARRTYASSWAQLNVAIGQGWQTLSAEDKSSSSQATILAKK